LKRGKLFGGHLSGERYLHLPGASTETFKHVARRKFPVPGTYHHPVAFLATKRNPDGVAYPELHTGGNLVREGADKPGLITNHLDRRRLHQRAVKPTGKWGKTG